MEKPSATVEAHSDSDTEEDYTITSLQLGIWQMFIPVKATGKLGLRRTLLGLHTGSSVWLRKWSAAKSTLPLIRRFLLEIYRLDPGLNLLVFALGLASAVEGTPMLYASSRLLRTVETGLATGRPDMNAILQAVILRLGCTVLTSSIRWAQMRVTPILQSRVEAHFEEYVFRAKLRLDLPTSTDKNNEVVLSPYLLWYHYQFLTGLFGRIFNLGSQLLFTMQQPRGGITLTLLSLVSPILSTQLRRMPWKLGFVAYASNLDYLRIRALNWLGSGQYREDVISGNLGDWISAEYNKAKNALGTTTDLDPRTQYLSRNTPATEVLMQLGGDLPMFYWAASVLSNPTGISITSFAILQQHAQALRTTLLGLVYEIAEVSDCVTNVQNLYKIEDVRNKVLDGEEAYPNSTLSTDKGMSFELKNVSFSYPGGKSKDNAVRNVTLKIPAGNLVVIVGANGSGKSTIIKLLNRLYDVDSGEILVDGIPIKNYRLSDLRKVQAVLSQDLRLYPLSLAENIGLGNPDRFDNMEMILEAAEAGGASEVIEKLENGVQTTLNPVQTAWSNQTDKYKKLQTILEKLEQEAKVSGGEKQRLVAARTFMRYLSGKIRFAVADEPSSAMDPKAEHRLFQRLRESGDGKTMIFVTHRFGHLTKHADLIICMRDGEAVETGTHKELLARGGEYAELYNVQAQAFSDGAL
ncbi:P-loop containing nucleoside triphosphate hydrolase protein [Mycena capillaripes]|nr:P-loop containing nucleoside triphosphate hydrolase protein [Mycena capillaripes]